MKDKILIVLSGAFGGMSTTLLALAISLTNGSDLPEKTFFLGLLMFALMGAGVALIWKENNLKKAFYIGLGFPAFIQANVSNFSNPQQEIGAINSKHSSVFSLSVKNAMAREPMKPTNRTFKNRTLRLIPGNINTPTYAVIFLSSDGNRQEKVVLPSTTKDKTVNVPDFAKSFKVLVGTSMSVEENLSQKETVVKVHSKIKTWSGLLQSIGVKNIKSQEIKITKER